MYLDRTLSLPACPRSLFLSPRAPSRSLPKNALSFFLRSVIADSYSSAGLSLPVVSLSSSASSSSSSRPRSSFRAHGFGVSRLLGRSIAMLLCLRFWRLLLGLLLLSLLLSIPLTFSFLPLRVLVWVRWWLRFPLCDVYVAFSR